MPFEVTECQYIRLGQVGPITDENQRSQLVYASASAQLTGTWARVRYCSGSIAPSLLWTSWWVVTKPALVPPANASCDVDQPCGGSITQAVASVIGHGATSLPARSRLNI